MGKQINFFMDNRDVNAFLEYGRKNNDVIMLINRQQTEAKSIVQALPESRDIRIFLWNKSISSPPKFDYIEKREYLLVNPEISEVIEFSRSMGLPHRVLQEGRLWIETSYYGEDGVLVKKSPTFIKWYESLVRWIKKNSVNMMDYRYVMPHANKLFFDQNLLGQKGG